MFGEESFTDEIDSPEQAEGCVEYLALNEHKFKRELQDDGLTYDEVQDKLKKVWSNLIASCERHGYTDVLIEQKKQQFGI